MSVVINGSSSVITNSGAVYDGIQRGTAVTASGTSVDFTSIPSWVKRITVMFNGVSTNGTSLPIVRLGTSGGIVSSGYDSTTTGITSGSFVNITNAFSITYTNSAASRHKGSITILNINGNTWVESGITGDSVNNLINSTSSGDVTLSGTLDRIRITTVNGTDTFDAGSINILYE